ncbi:MAG: heme-degrading domain-containing protein [Propionivibrio sp.]
MSHDDLLAELITEQENLRFGRFGFDEACAIGQDLIAHARRDRLAVTIDVAVSGQQLFHAALPGTSPDNDQWVIRKNRVVGRFFRSSYYIAKLLEAKGETMEAAFGLPSADFAPFGGAVPITMKGVGVVGTVTVSGLPHQDDHRMVVEAMRRFMEKSAMR